LRKNGIIKDIDRRNLAEDPNTAKTLSLLIEKAISLGASDIHIEPREDYGVIRYRIDGQLKEAHKLPQKSLDSLTSRVKYLANLNLDQQQLPQDGQFIFDYK